MEFGGFNELRCNTKELFFFFFLSIKLYSLESGVYTALDKAILFKGWVWGGIQQQQHPSPAQLYADLFINLGWSRCAAHVENPEHVAGT